MLAIVALRLVDSAVLRGREASLEASVEETGDWTAYLQAESEDRSFLLTQLEATESELVGLQQFAQAAVPKRGLLAGLQISAAPVVKNSGKNASVKPAVAKAPVAKAAPAAKKEGAAPVATKAAPAAKKEGAAPVAKKAVAKPDAAEETDPAKLVASLGIPGFKSKLKGTAALAPMLAMLKGLYQDSKDRISQQNAREEKSKKWFAEKEAEHKAKLAKIEGRFKNHTLSEEFRTNETRDETRYFSYWSRCRERQHRQFHTNLKIQHAMMMKTKKMIDIYEKTLSGKASDHEQAQKKLSQMTGGGMPEIVLLQEMQSAVRSFCLESLAEVRKEKEELQQPVEEGAPW